MQKNNCTFIIRECWRLHKRSCTQRCLHPCAPCWQGVILKASAKVAQTVAVLACTISHKLFKNGLSPHVSANAVKTHPELVRRPEKKTHQSCIVAAYASESAVGGRSPGLRQFWESLRKRRAKPTVHEILQSLNWLGGSQLFSCSLKSLTGYIPN